MKQTRCYNTEEDKNIIFSSFINPIKCKFPQGQFSSKKTDENTIKLDFTSFRLEKKFSIKFTSNNNFQIKSGFDITQIILYVVAILLTIVSITSLTMFIISQSGFEYIIFGIIFVLVSLLFLILCVLIDVILWKKIDKRLTQNFNCRRIKNNKPTFDNITFNKSKKDE